MFNSIPLDELKKHVRLEPDGTLWWKTPQRGRRSGGQAFTTKQNKGYLVGMIDGVRLSAHRVVWALHYGEWPSGWLDHINRNPSDNRVENLRIVDATQSNHNRDSWVKRGPYRGVIKDPNCNKFRAQIQHRKKIYYLGLFFTAEEAAKARDAKALELYGRNALLNFPEEHDGTESLL
jgi:hypothetical protein